MKKLLLLFCVFSASLGSAQMFLPTEETEVLISNVNSPVYDMSSADLNGDGVDELIYYSANGANKIYIYNPDDGTTLELTVPVSQGGTLKFGDFNEDGKLDIVSGQQTVTLFLSDDSKSFLAPGFYVGSQLATLISDIAIGDYDENNNLDIIVAYSTPHKWAVFSGDGLGGFTETNLGLPASWNATSSYTSSIELVDFNGDDHLDIVGSGKSQPSPAAEFGITVSLGDGAGNFTFASDYFSTQDLGTNSPYFYGIKPLLTDTDGDNEIDIIFKGNFGAATHVMHNNGASAPTITTLDVSLGKLVDFDGDFNDDIILRHFDHNRHYDIMLADGNGNFTYDRSFSTTTSQGSEFTMADTNGDGEPDLVFYDSGEKTIEVATYNTGYYTYNGLVGGNELIDEAYTDAVVAELDFGGYDDLLTLFDNSLAVMKHSEYQWKFDEATYYATPDNPTSIEVIDLLDDGKPEVFVGSGDVSNNNITLFTNDGSGALTSSTQFVASAIIAMTSADMNGDDKPDLIALTSTDVLILLNDGTGGLENPVSYGISSSKFIDTGDMNGDGFIDVVISSTSRNYIHYGDGTGSITVNNTDFGTHRMRDGGFKVEDVNNDNIDDIIAIYDIPSSLNTSAYVIFGEADKLISQLSSITTTWRGNAEYFNLADFNGDGNIDIITNHYVDSKYRMLFLFGDGAGNFIDDAIAPIPVGYYQSSWANVQMFNVGDINFDDKPDVVYILDHMAHTFLNVFEQATEPTTPASNLVVGTPDFNGTSLSWDRGNGDNVLVIVAEDAIDMTKLPADFSISQDLGINVIKYDGTGTSGSSGALKKNKTYEVGVIEYNGSTISANYFTSGFPTASFTTPKGNQTITFNYTAGVAFTITPFSPPATVNSGLEISFEVVSGPAEVTPEGKILLTGIGSVTLRAKQEGDNEWNAASSVDQTFTVIQGPQTITFNLSASLLVSYTNYKLPIHSSGGLPISYNLDSGPGSLITDGDTTWYVWDGEGSIALTASQAGSTELSAAVPITRNTTISKRDQTITWNRSIVIQNKNQRNILLEGESIQMMLDTLELNAISSAGLPVTYIIFGGPGFLKGIGDESRKYIYKGVGDVTITAGASGDDVYNSAFPQNIDFTIIKGDQTISTNATINGSGLSTYSYDTDVWVKLNAVTSSGLDLTYEPSVISTVTIVGDSVNVTEAGSIRIDLNQPGDDNWNAASRKQVAWTVSKASQTVTFDDIYENWIVKDSIMALGATNDSGEEIRYDIIRNPSSANASVNGNELTVNSTSRSGAITIRAYSLASTNYLQSSEVLVDFCLLAATPTLELSGLGSSQVILTSTNSVDYAEWQKDGAVWNDFQGSPQATIQSQGLYRVRARSHDFECPVSDYSEEASIIVTGLGDASDRLSIYPNPAKSFVNVILPLEASDKIAVFATDMSGKTMELNYAKHAAKKLSVDVSQLPKGSYILHLKTGDNVFYQKLNKE